MYILYIIVLKIKLITNLHALSVAIHVLSNTCTVLSRVLVGSVTYDVNKPVGKIGTVVSSLFWNIIFLFTSNLIPPVVCAFGVK